MSELPTRTRDPFAPIGAEAPAPFDATAVAGGNLADRLAAARRVSGSEEAPVDTPAPVIEELTSEVSVDSDVDSPIYDQLMAEQAEAGLETDPSADNVDSQGSRIANLLRSSANIADSGAEKWDNTKQAAKKRLSLIGRAAARFGSASREFAAGARVIATEKALDVADRTTNKVLEVADRADDALFNAADSAKESVKAGATKAAEKTGEAIMNGIDKVGDKMISLKEGAKERLVSRMNAAFARRQARRERWAARITGAKESVSNGLDRSAELAMAAGRKLENGMDKVGDRMVSAKESASNKVERTRESTRAIRQIGRLAIDNRSNK